MWATWNEPLSAYVALSINYFFWSPVCVRQPGNDGGGLWATWHLCHVGTINIGPQLYSKLIGISHELRMFGFWNTAMDATAWEPNPVPHPKQVKKTKQTKSLEKIASRG